MFVSVCVSDPSHAHAHRLTPPAPPCARPTCPPVPPVPPARSYIRLGSASLAALNYDFALLTLAQDMPPGSATLPIAPGSGRPVLDLQTAGFPGAYVGRVDGWIDGWMGCIERTCMQGARWGVSLSFPT